MRCVLRTALPTAGLQQNKRPVYVRVTRMDPALGGGAQFKIRAREATIYGRWLTAVGYDYHVEVENATADAMCVEVARYPASGLTYAPGPGWSGSIASFQLNVPAFGAVKQVMPKGSAVGVDSEGTLRSMPAGRRSNLLPGGLHVSTYAFDAVADRFIYFFTSTANEGKTRSTLVMRRTGMSGKGADHERRTEGDVGDGVGRGAECLAALPAQAQTVGPLANTAWQCAGDRAGRVVAAADDRGWGDAVVRVWGGAGEDVRGGGGGPGQ